MREAPRGPFTGLQSMVGLRQTPERAEARRRLAEESWLEWTFRDFLRYFYLLGVLAAITLVPLQMSDSWLPYGGAAVIEPALVGGFILVFVLVALYLGIQGYLFLWRENGAVNRALTRWADRASARSKGPSARVR